MSKKEEPKAKTKRPTAEKRVIQSEKRRLINKSFKSQVRTVMRSFEEALEAKDKERVKASLSEIYSVMDKGVKRRLFTTNKAGRLKERAFNKTAAL